MITSLRRRRRGFTLVEIMIVVAIIAILASIGIPIRSRKRAQATRIYGDLRLIDAAIELYAIEKGKAVGDAVTWADIQANLKNNSSLYSAGGLDLLGNSYGTFSVDTNPTVPAATFESLSDIAPAEFWSPYK